jgi:hypothetical protein
MSRMSIIVTCRPRTCNLPHPVLDYGCGALDISECAQDDVLTMWFQSPEPCHCAEFLDALFKTF